MLTIRRATDRGHADHGWLDSHHTFSFADYYDPKHMGFRALRVINDDRVAAGKGFGVHSHRDMEIISYVLSGSLAHKDSTGTGAVIHPGDIQRMSAGTGVTHSELNASKTEPVHFLQIWIQPDKHGIAPGYEQKTLPAPQGHLQLVASRDGRDGSVTIYADANVYTGKFGAGESAQLSIDERRGAWVHVARGKVRINGKELSDGDGAAIVGESIEITGIDGGDITGIDGGDITGIDGGELLVFDLA